MTGTGSDRQQATILSCGVPAKGYLTMRSTRLRCVLVALALLAIILTEGCSRPNQPGSTSGSAQYRIAVFLAADHPVIQQLYEGFVDRMAEKPWAGTNAVEYTVRNAAGDAAALNTIAAELADGDYAAIYVVGIPAAQALLKRHPKSPVICGGPPDPVAAGLAESLEHPGRRATGTTMTPPVGRQLDLLRQLYPEIRRLAILFSPGEANAVTVADAVDKAAAEKGMQPVRIPVSTASELKPALALAESSADAYYVGTDNMLHSVIQAVADAAIEAKKPLINCSEASVQKGALFSLAADYYEVGRLSADMMDAIVIERKGPSNIPFREVQEPTLYVNTSTAQKLGVSFPSEWLASAKIYPPK